MFVNSFIRQWMKRSKHELFVFPPKKTLIWRRHCSICQFCCSMTSKRRVDWFVQSSSGMKFFHLSVRLRNQKPLAFVSVRQTNQVAPFPLVCCFCFVRAFSFQGHTKIARLLEIPIDYCFEHLTILCKELKDYLKIASCSILVPM